VCFPFNVLMVHLTKLTIVVDGELQTGGGFTHGKTICFGSLELITNRFNSLSLSTKGNDSGAIFVGMAQSGSPSLHAILEDSVDEGDTTSSGGRSSSLPVTEPP
jgi:hypothetical protein